MLSIENLCLERGDRRLFEQLSFTLGPGTLTHLKGENGSGKTTLMRAVCGLTRPESGHIRWQGEDIHTLGDEYRAQLAYIGHKNGLKGELTVAENLRFARAMAATPAGDAHEDTEAAIDAAIARVELGPQRRLATKHLSQGQKRRAALARLMLTGAPLWVLDEPFNALDVASCERLGALVAEHVAGGGMALVTSHTPLPLDPAAVQDVTLKGAA